VTTPFWFFVFGCGCGFGRVYGVDKLYADKGQFTPDSPMCKRLLLRFCVRMECLRGDKEREETYRTLLPVMQDVIELLERCPTLVD